jgi:hypothetical protein
MMDAGRVHMRASSCCGLVVIAVVGGLGCGRSGSAPAPAFAVSGTVLLGDRPASGARVSIAGQGQLADANGAFAFASVPVGAHVLEARYDLGDATFVARRKALVVAGASEHEEIRLPQPVTVTASASGDGIGLEWTRFEGSEFREYQVFSAVTPGSLQIPGSLASVITDQGDTSVVVPPPTGVEACGFVGSNRYAQVVVLDDVGLVAASNVVQITVPKWPPATPRPYELRLAAARAPAGEVGGVAWDGRQLWVAYHAQGGEYFEPVRIVATDLAGQELRAFDERAEYGPTGMAWADGELWVAYASGNTSVIKAYDPESGAVRRRFVIDDVSGLAWDGTNLLLQTVDEIETMTPSGALGLRTRLPGASWCYAYAGIARRPGETWLAETWGAGLVLLDDSGRHIGVVTDVSEMQPLASPYGRVPVWRALSFAGDRLAMAWTNRLALYDVVPSPAPQGVPSALGGE